MQTQSSPEPTAQAFAMPKDDISKMSIASIVKTMTPQQQREFAFRTGLADTSKLSKKQLSEIQKDVELGFLDFLDPAEKAVLRYSWKFWARPNQLVDMDDPSWEVLLILAGRGYGKTRTGAEWVRGLVEAASEPIRINLIGPTASDTRDTMVRGESGLITVSPPWLKAEYSPSNRRVTWANGSIATLYSAEEPERLRGPQAHYQWCDELCLLPSTIIETSTGPIILSDVKSGDMVLTRRGYKRVVRSWQTSPAAKVYRLRTYLGREIVGTAKHPVYVEGKGFRPLASLTRGDRLVVASRGMGASGMKTPEMGTSGIAQESCSTEQFLPSTTERSLPDSISIISTKTPQTTPSRTCSRSQEALTSFATSREVLLPTQLPSTPSAQSGAGRSSNPRSGLAANAAAHSSARGSDQCAALITVDRSHQSAGRKRPGTPAEIRAPLAFVGCRGAGRPRRRNATASFAASPSSSAIRDHSVAPGAADTSFDLVEAVEMLPDLMPVNNIEVEGEHEYFANGILTHNCSWKQAQDVWDMAQMGLRLGRDPRTVITTTPKPTALLKKILVDKKTKIVRGSTYENKDNLAGTFIHSVIRQYEGTDLGRQELHAEVLSENKNALWNRQTLARCRVGNDRQLRIEDMAQVVVAVDPPASSSEKSDECGLVVCGLTHTRMGVVLADRSGVMSPKKWAQAALQAAKDFHADRIVAERNNGGEMVKHTLRSYHEGGLDGSKVPVKTVFASRGKWTRAEPIASLFQQERCLLNGIFPQLEDQLCEFDPLEGDKSPDRFDAMVWGLTDLMLRSGTRFFI